MYIMNEKIINSVKKFNNFYKISYFNKIINYFKNNKINLQIKENNLELLGFIIHIFINKTNFGIKFKNSTNKYYRKLNLNKLQKKNLIYSLKSNNFIINNKILPDEIYIIIDDNNYDIFPNKNNLCNITQLFGLENINILNYINVDYFNKLFESKEGIHSREELKKYVKLLKSNSQYLQFTSIILSSMVLFVIGCTTAEDVDIMIFNKMDNKEIKNMTDIMGKNNLDPRVLKKNNLWWKHKDKSYNYWMTYALGIEWVKSVNANSIEEIFFDSKHYFYLHGVKFISIELEFQRLLKRNSLNAYIDIYALHKFNNYKINFPLTVSKLQMRAGWIKFLEKKDYDEIITKIVQRLRWWHNIKENENNIRKLFIYESNKAYDKYTRVNRLSIFDNLRKYHQYIKFFYLKNYCNCDIIIDVGSSDLKDLKFWKQLNVKHVYSLEPSEELFKIGLNKQSKDNFAKNKITYIRATGEDKWSDGSAGLDEDSKKKLISMKGIKANCITFEFSFHYMMDKIDVVIKNIKEFSNKGTKVIIHTLNGNVVKDSLKDRKKFIVKKGDDEVFYLEKLYNDDDKFKKINVYFKGVTGLDNIVPEYIVEQDYIINKFLDNGFKVFEYTKFLDRYESKFNLEKHEIDVSNLYITYIFILN